MNGAWWAKTQEPGYDSCVGHAAILFLAVHRSTPPVIPISGQLRHLAVADLGLSLVAARFEKKTSGDGTDQASIFWRGSVYFRWNADGLVLSIGFTTFYSGLWWLFLFDGPVPPLLSYFHCSWSVGQWLPQDLEGFNPSIAHWWLELSVRGISIFEFPPFGSEWKWWWTQFFWCSFNKDRRGDEHFQHSTRNTLW